MGGGGWGGVGLIDAIRRPAQAFVAVSKQTKPLWLVITGVATAIGIGTAAQGSFSAIGILSVVAFVAAAVYLTDVRPNAKAFPAGGTAPPTPPYTPSPP